MADGRGYFKIFLGMAAGVGKTYRMLQEGRAEVAAGRDVVVGYLEGHRRQETIEQAEGLERLPRRHVEYRGAAVEEMDLPAVFQRAPDLCLIDELAHTNPPGVENAKRWQDIEDVLDAGVDVLSTVNVQHLESLNDSVYELTGVRVRETFPDRVLSAADEVVLIDLTPEALIARLQAGKVYPADRVPAALNNFFRVENLATLREVALRQVAEDVEAKRMVEPPPRLGTRGDEGEDEGPQPVAERLLVLVRPQPGSQRLVRRAWRAAQRLGGDLDALFVAAPGKRLSDDERAELEAVRRLCSVLGVDFVSEEGQDVAKTAAHVAAERDTTYVFMGQPRPARGMRRWGGSLPERLMERLPGVDVRIVADR